MSFQPPEKRWVTYAFSCDLHVATCDTGDAAYQREYLSVRFGHLNLTLKTYEYELKGEVK